MGLEAIMEHYDGAWTSMLNRFSVAPFRGNFLGKISTQYIPHHHLVAFLDTIRLGGIDSAVRRTEQIRFYPQLPGTGQGIGVVLGGRRLPAIEVVEGMVAHRMTLFQYLLKNVRVLLNVMADTKKSGLGLVRTKLVQHELGYLRDWPIIEGEVQGIGAIGHPP